MHSTHVTKRLANNFRQEFLDYTFGVCTMRGMASHAQVLAEHLLGEPFTAYSTRLRDKGFSWRGIARQLHSDTDGTVDVTEQTLRNWLSAEEAA